MNNEILLKYIKGKATESEKAEVVRWVESDDKNFKEYRALRRLYDISVCSEPQDIVSDKKARPYNMFWLISNIAAILIVGLFISIRLFYFEKKIEYQTITVPSGQMVQLTLSDSTKVWLNSKSTLKLPSSLAQNKERKVYLDGEGYFCVAKDKKRPFVVKTKNHNIRVLGTEFNVIAYEDNDFFETALINGSVNITTPDDEPIVRLKPGMKVSDNGKGELLMEAIKHYNDFEWRNGLICFEKMKFTDLLSMLQEKFDVRIVIDNPYVMEQYFTGKFKISDGLEHILSTLSISTKFGYTILDNEESNN